MVFSIRRPQKTKKSKEAFERSAAIQAGRNIRGEIVLKGEVRPITQERLAAYKEATAGSGITELQIQRAPTEAEVALGVSLPANIRNLPPDVARRIVLRTPEIAPQKQELSSQLVKPVAGTQAADVTRYSNVVGTSIIAPREFAGLPKPIPGSFPDPLARQKVLLRDTSPGGFVTTTTPSGQRVEIAQARLELIKAAEFQRQAKRIEGRVQESGDFPVSYGSITPVVQTSQTKVYEIEIGNQKFIQREVAPEGSEFVTTDKPQQLVGTVTISEEQARINRLKEIERQERLKPVKISPLEEITAQKGLAEAFAIPFRSAEERERAIQQYRAEEKFYVAEQQREQNIAFKEFERNLGRPAIQQEAAAERARLATLSTLGDFGRITVRQFTESPGGELLQAGAFIGALQSAPVRALARKVSPGVKKAGGIIASGAFGGQAVSEFRQKQLGGDIAGSIGVASATALIGATGLGGLGRRKELFKVRKVLRQRTDVILKEQGRVTQPSEGFIIGRESRKELFLDLTEKDIQNALLGKADFDVLGEYIPYKVVKLPGRPTGLKVFELPVVRTPGKKKATDIYGIAESLERKGVIDIFSGEKVTKYLRQRRFLGSTTYTGLIEDAMGLRKMAEIRLLKDLELSRLKSITKGGYKLLKNAPFIDLKTFLHYSKISTLQGLGRYKKTVLAHELLHARFASNRRVTYYLDVGGGTTKAVAGKFENIAVTKGLDVAVRKLEIEAYQKGFNFKTIHYKPNLEKAGSLAKLYREPKKTRVLMFPITSPKVYAKVSLTGEILEKGRPVSPLTRMGIGRFPKRDTDVYLYGKEIEKYFAAGLISKTGLKAYSMRASLGELKPMEGKSKPKVFEEFKPRTQKFKTPEKNIFSSLEKLETDIETQGGMMLKGLGKVAQPRVKPKTGTTLIRPRPPRKIFEPIKLTGGLSRGLVIKMKPDIKTGGKQDLTTMGIFRPLEEFLQKPISRPKQRQEPGFLLSPAEGFKSFQSSLTGQKAGLQIAVSFGKLPTFKPFLLPPGFDLLPKKSSRQKRTSLGLDLRRATKYRPSLVAVEFKIKTKKKPGYDPGLGIRPILVK